MTRSELQTAIKAYREQGYEVKVKLNTTNEALQAEYDRLQAAFKSHNVDTVENCKPVAPVVKVAEVAEVVEVVEVMPIVEVTAVAEVVEVAETTAVSEVVTPRNIAAEVVAEVKATDTYWMSWNAAYYRAVDVLATKRYQGELTAYQDKWNSMMSKKSNSHADFGIILAFVILQSWQVFTSLVVPVLGQTITAVRNILINQTLAFKGFKSAAKFAKKTAIA